MHAGRSVSCYKCKSVSSSIHLLHLNFNVSLPEYHTSISVQYGNLSFSGIFASTHDGVEDNLILVNLG